MTPVWHPKTLGRSFFGELGEGEWKLLDGEEQGQAVLISTPCKRWHGPTITDRGPSPRSSEEFADLLHQFRLARSLPANHSLQPGDADGNQRRICTSLHPHNQHSRNAFRERS
jgi:hypothetical protein